MIHFDTWLMMRASTLLAVTSWCSRIEGHPRMLARCSTRTLVSVSVASTKVALSLQGVSLAKSRRKESLGLHYACYVG